MKGVDNTYERERITQTSLLTRSVSSLKACTVVQQIYTRLKYGEAEGMAVQVQEYGNIVGFQIFRIHCDVKLTISFKLS